MAEKIHKERRFRYLSSALVVTLLALVALLILVYLDRKGIVTLPQTIVSNIRSLLLVVGTLFAISLILRLTLKRFHRLFEEPEERIFYSKIYGWSLYTIGFLIFLHHFGVSLGNITLFLGLIATGLAFAVREVLLSFFAWLILLRKKPFRIGDYIRIGEDEGKVLHIGTFYVLLDQTTQIPEDYTRVPNRLFLEKSIINLGKSSFHEEIFFPLKEIPAERESLLADLGERLEGILEKQGNLSLYFDQNKDKLGLMVEYMISFDRRRQVRSEVIETIFSSLGPFLFLPG